MNSVCLRRLFAQISVHVFCVDFPLPARSLEECLHTATTTTTGARDCVAEFHSAQQWLPKAPPIPSQSEGEGVGSGSRLLYRMWLCVCGTKNRFSQCDKISTAASVLTAFRPSAPLNPFKLHVHVELTVYVLYEGRRVAQLIQQGKQHVSRGINCGGSGNCSTHPSRRTSLECRKCSLTSPLTSLLPTLLGGG